MGLRQDMIDLISVGDTDQIKYHNMNIFEFISKYFNQSTANLLTEYIQTLYNQPREDVNNSCFLVLVQIVAGVAV